MAGEKRPAAKTPCRTPRREFATARLAMRAAKLLVALTAAAAVIGLAGPAQAAPADPYVHVASATDDTFLQAIDRLGIEDPSGPEAVYIAKAACAHIQNGNGIREAVDGVRNASSGLPLLKSAHFVAVARAIYCPDTPDW